MFEWIRNGFRFILLHSLLWAGQNRPLKVDHLHMFNSPYLMHSQLIIFVMWTWRRGLKENSYKNEYKIRQKELNWTKATPFSC